MEMKLKEEIYKGVKIIYEVDESGTFTSNALGIFRVYEKDISGTGFKKIKDAENAIKIKIDKFLNKTAKNYKELAESIEESLVWNGYEECHVDEFIIKTIVGNFIKLNRH